LKGDFGFGNIAPSPFYEPEFKYNVTGTFEREFQGFVISIFVVYR
jgi:hypothetical protein